MSENTKIEWTDSTWNPVRGCSLVSDGCKNCYAMHVAHRFNRTGQPYDGLATKTTQGPKWTGKIMLVPGILNQPLRWKRQRKIFVNSMSDLFHEGVPDWFIDRVFVVMALAHQHTFQILTKRPERMRDYVNSFNWLRAIESCRDLHDGVSVIERHTLQVLNLILGNIQFGSYVKRNAWPLPNVWLGVSVENQQTANNRIPTLLVTPAAKRFLSMEPLLGPVDLRSIPHGDSEIDALKPDTWEDVINLWRDTDENWIEQFEDWFSVELNDELTGPIHAGVDWVIVGGESGPNARPLHPDWVREIQAQCDEAGVPFFFKQWGEWLPDNQNPSITSAELNGAIRIGKKMAGRMLDGVEYNQFPVS